MRASAAAALALALFLFVFGISGAAADTILVRPDGTGDYPTIKAAINASAPGDTVLLDDGIFLGSGNRKINFSGKAVMLRSAGGDPAACVIDCESAGRGFYIASSEGAGTVIEGITVRNGFVQYPDYGGGAIRCDGASPTIIDCVFENNVSLSGGLITDLAFGAAGGIFCGDASPIITGCVFSGNSSDYQGGGLYCTGFSSPTVTDCIFIDNYGSSGGGMFVGQNSNPIVTGCEFRGNSAEYAAGLQCTESSSPQITDCLFIENVANGSGGAVTCWSYSSPTLDRCLFIRNEATGGAGLYAGEGSDPVVTNGTFHQNVTGAEGSVVFAYESAMVTMENCILTSTVNGRAAGCGENGVILFTCSDLFGNAGGDWTGCAAGQEGLDGNFSADPLYCDAAGDNYRIEDLSPCAPANSPSGCGLIGAFPAGCVATGVAGAESAPPARLTLSPNVPNPFNPATVIRFTIPEGRNGGSIDLAVFDTAGRRVRTLLHETAVAGPHSITWDGRDDRGRSVSSGVYLYRIADGVESRTGRMVLVR